MRTFFPCLLACLALLACGDASAPGPKKTDTPTPAPVVKDDTKLIRFLMVPFENRTKGTDKDYFSLGLAALLTERFEEISQDPAIIAALAAKGYRLDIVSGPLMLTPAQAQLRKDTHAELDLEAVQSVASAQGANRVITGSYAGGIEKFVLAVDVFDVDPAQGLVAKGAAETKPTSIYLTGKNVARPGVQIALVSEMLATIVGEAMEKAGMPLPPEALARLGKPQTLDALSFIEYARGLAAHFHVGPEMKKSDIEFAAHAVSIWPDFYSARRLYGFLLWQEDEVLKARVHLREIIEPTQPVEEPPKKGEKPKPKKPRRVGLPNDIRTLLMLGRIEIEAKQPSAAIGYLERAAKIRAEDANVHFWLGEAHARLGDSAEAIARYETSRRLAPDNVETHRALSGLYASAKRYADAATELEFVVAHEPQNLQAVMLLAACDRAANHRDLALAAYDAGLKRFPNDVRLHKFRADILSTLGRENDAHDALVRARRLAPKDARFTFERRVLTGDVLIASIVDADKVRDGMEKRRGETQLADSLAIWDLGWYGKAACEDGRAGSYFLFAQDGIRGYDLDGANMQVLGRDIGRALDNAEGDALTPDERARAESLLRYRETSVQDLRETRTGYDTAKGLLDKNGCSLEKIAVAKIDEIRARNQKLIVKMPDPPAKNNSGISPVVPTGTIGNAEIYIENRSGLEYVLVLDGKPLEPSVSPLSAEVMARYPEQPDTERRLDHQDPVLPSDKGQRYTFQLGYHVFCLLPKAQAKTCGKTGTEHRGYVYEGLNVVIR